MKTRNTLIALAAVAATVSGMAAPAFAQSRAAVTVTIGHNSYWDHDRRDHNRWDYNRRDDRAEYMIEGRISNLRARIDMGRREGRISWREADRLQGQLRNIVWTKASFERSGRGLDGREVAILDQRINNLSAQVRYERHDRNRW